MQRYVVVQESFERRQAVTYFIAKMELEHLEDRAKTIRGDKGIGVAIFETLLRQNQINHACFEVHWNGNRFFYRISNQEFTRAQSLALMMLFPN